MGRPVGICVPLLLCCALVAGSVQSAWCQSDRDEAPPEPRAGDGVSQEPWEVRNGLEDDEIFATFQGYDLDQYLYYEDGPLEFDIVVDRVYSRDNSDWDEIIRSARLVLRVYDVDEESSECEGDPAMAERDFVYINGHLCERNGVAHYLTGANNTWTGWSYDIPLEWFENGWVKTATYRVGQPPLPGVNHIRIDIDTASHHCWAVECDWGYLEIQGTRPSLLVHGMQWKSWGGESSWDEFAPHVDGGLCERASLNGRARVAVNALTVRRQFNSMLEHFGVQRANIIAHSKGGLDSRAFFGQQDGVAALVTVGTPNAGTEFADHAMAEHPGLAGVLFGDAVRNLTTAFVADTLNPAHPHVQGVSYYSIGGNLYSAEQTTCDLAWCEDQIFTGRNDGRVPMCSAPLPWQSGVDASERREHSELIKQGAEHIYTQHIRGWLNGTISARQYRPQSPVAGARVPVARGVGDEPREPRSSEQMTPFMRAVVVNGLPVDSTLLLDQCDRATLLAYADRAVTFTLRTPTGAVIDSIYAGSHGDVDYEARTGSWFGHSYAYVLESPQPGAWHIVLASGDTSSVVAGAVVEGDLQLIASVDSGHHDLGEPVTVSASLADAGVPVAGATAEAVLSRVDGYEERLSMADVGSGQYRAVCTPQQTGSYDISVTAAGTARVPFCRQAVTHVTVHPTHASVSGIGAGYGEDTNGNGLYDGLVFPVTLAVTAADSFRVRGALRSPGGTSLGCASAYIHCPVVGSHQVSLVFDGESIHRAGEDGPYTLHGLILSEMGGSSLVVEESALTAQTPAYGSGAFERPLVRFTQRSSEVPLDHDSDGYYDSLVILAGVDLAYGGQYEWNGRLVDRYGSQIEWADGSGYLPAGQDSIMLEYSGIEICSSGVDGPYYVRDLYIFSSDTYGVDAEDYDAHETAPYSFTEFEHGPTDLVLLHHTLSCSVGAPYVGEPVTLSATVVNVGDDCGDEITVRFYEAGAQPSEIIGEQHFSDLAFGESETAEISWFTPRTPGSYAVAVVVDPDGAVGENDELNNDGEIQLEVLDRGQTEDAMVDGVVRPGDIQCRILLELDRSSSARVLVYDLRGRCIKRVLDDSLPDGKTTLSWDLTDDSGQQVASGTYVCFIEVDGRTYSRKVTVVR